MAVGGGLVVLVANLEVGGEHEVGAVGAEGPGLVVSDAAVLGGRDGDALALDQNVLELAGLANARRPVHEAVRNPVRLVDQLAHALGQVVDRVALLAVAVVGVLDAVVDRELRAGVVLQEVVVPDVAELALAHRGAFDAAVVA